MGHGWVTVGRIWEVHLAMGHGWEVHFAMGHGWEVHFFYPPKEGIILEVHFAFFSFIIRSLFGMIPG